MAVRLPAWLEAQHVLGEAVPARWRRIGAELDVEVVFTQDVVEDADLLVDGTVIDLDTADLLHVVLEGRHLARVEHVPVDEGWESHTLIFAAPAGGLPLGLVDDLGEVEPIAVWSADGVADLEDLQEVEASIAERLQTTWTERGVRFVGTSLVAPTVFLESGVTVWQGVTLLGATTVRAGAVLHVGCHLTDTIVGEDATLKPYSVCEGAVIGQAVTVGPFAHLRPGTMLGRGSKVGNFVETKNTTLGPGAKANHLTYLGDATVGADTNVGAGTITCNYDGARKHRTAIGERVFVGTNSSLVAPIEVGDDALIAAGSVVTEDVPAGSLVVGRADQRTVPDKGAAILARNKRIKSEGS